MNRTRHNMLFLVAAMCGLTGCEQFYTGSVGFKSVDQDQVEAYQKFKQEQAAQLKVAKLQQERTGPVDFEAPHSEQIANAGANSEIVPAASFATQANSTPQAAAASPMRRLPVNNQPRHSVGQLGLYGGVNNVSSQDGSPLNATGDLSQMTFTAEGADFDPDTDPTGKFIVYASTRHRDTADLYIKRVDGAAVTRITADPANEVMPVYSPDGQWVAFASDRSGTWDIYIMPAKGGPARQLTRDATQNLHPSFSPDGQRLTYCSYGGPSGQWEIMVINVASPTTKRVIANGLFPVWNPKSDTILFQRARQRGTRWFSVWTLDLVNDEPSPPTEIAVSANAAVITPDWSPDGKQVVFCTVIDPEAEDTARPTQADLWVTGADGTGRVKLTTGRYANLQPTWSADGTILFVSDRAANGIENIWALKPGDALTPIAPASHGRAPTSVMVPTD